MMKGLRCKRKKFRYFLVLMTNYITFNFKLICNAFKLTYLNGKFHIDSCRDRFFMFILELQNFLLLG